MSMNLFNIFTIALSSSIGVAWGYVIGRNRKSDRAWPVYPTNSHVDVPPPSCQKPVYQPTISKVPERIETESAVPAFMIGLVDLIDEIELIKTRSDGVNSETLSMVQSRLQDKIELAGGYLIRETVWNPSHQRAVKVEPGVSDQAETVFQQSISTGLMHNGRIIRKQEVVISQPKTSTVI
jgi:hypothetical protein